MRIEKIDLYKYFDIEKGNVSGGTLCAYVRDDMEALKHKTRPAALVIPGGAYTMVCDREGEPVALGFLNVGYTAFVLDYSVNVSYPVPLDEALMAVAYIKENAEKYNVDKDRMVAIGFSAGGHLTATLATATEEEMKRQPFSASKPSAVILSYPVITMGEYTHERTRDVITDNGRIVPETLSIENRVDADSTPAFIWHTYEDDGVPVENSLLLADAYRKVGVPFSLHIFEKGWHGISLSNLETSDENPADVAIYHVGKWLDLAIDWLASRGFKVKS